MAQQVRGVIAREKKKPVEVVTIVVPDPGPGEALVAVQACGVCHTDLHYREGGINDDFPFLLGHEAAGVVEAVGTGVTGVAPGDFVILNWRAVCGTCRSCRKGKPWLCFSTFNATQKMTLTDGTVLAPALGIGAFAEKTLVAAVSAHPSTGRRRRRPPVASRGSRHWAALTTNASDSVAVLGRGGVATESPAHLATTTPSPRDRKPQWLPPGATHRRRAAGVRWRREGRPTASVPTHQAVGNPKCRQAFFARDLAGTVVQVGVPTPDMRMPDIPMIEFFGRGGALKPSWYGDCLPSRDFPMLIDLYLQGRLDLDRFVSETIDLDQVEEAFHRMERGEVLRSVVTL
jgi:S-(hydroxymethyl)mycothiol dehydrogenase